MKNEKLMIKKELQKKIKNIKFFISDVDNVLTNGYVYYSSTGTDTIAIHVHDGSGVKLLQQGNIKVGLISGRKSDAITKWATVLGIDEIFTGHLNKLIPYEDIKNKYNLNDSEIAYIGDDLTDYSVLSRVGFAITVSNAVQEVKETAHYVTTKNPGNGAIREVAEIILKVQGKWEKTISYYKNYHQM